MARINNLKPGRACKCRNRDCGKKYNSLKARGEYRGFCSAKCQHEVARYYGYRKNGGRSEFDVLKGARMVGDLPWNHGAIVAVGWDSVSKVYAIKFADGDIELYSVSEFEKKVGKEAYRNLCGVAAHTPNRMFAVTKDLQLTTTEVFI